MCIYHTLNLPRTFIFDHTFESWVVSCIGLDTWLSQYLSLPTEICEYFDFCNCREDFFLTNSSFLLLNNVNISGDPWYLTL